MLLAPLQRAPSASPRIDAATVRIGVASRLLGMAALSMTLLACQPIDEEPDAGPPVNHPPRIVEGFATPDAVVVDVLQGNADCSKGVSFSVGKVEDDDIDQTIQERWTLDYPGSSAFLQVTLQRVQNAPSFATDPSPAYVVNPQAVAGLATGTHVVDVYVSDGFDNAEPGVTRPTDVLPGSYLARKSWVLVKNAECAQP